jgi:hypothetical protein
MIGLSTHIQEAVAKRSAGKYTDMSDDLDADYFYALAKNSDIRELQFGKDIRDSRIFHFVSDDVLNDFLVKIIEKERESVFLDLPSGELSRRMFFAAFDKKLGAVTLVFNDDNSVRCIYIMKFDSNTRRYRIQRTCSVETMYDCISAIKKILDNA